MELDEVAERYGLADDATAALQRLLEALAAEPDPHTSAPPDRWADVHVADSLAALEVPGLRSVRRIADIGAGAGFPGLPLAIALPGTQFDLIESSGRKVALIERLAGTAGAANASAIRARVEDWAREAGRGTYEVVCARAVGPLSLLAEYGAPLLRSDGVLVAWKGARDATEEEAGARAAREVGLEPVEVRYVEPYPGSRQRHLHLYRKVRDTPERFPRRSGVAAKRPLG